jgi:hypothetical protein
MSQLFSNVISIIGIQSASPSSPLVIPGATTYNAYGYEYCQCDSASFEDPRGDDIGAICKERYMSKEHEVGIWDGKGCKSFLFKQSSDENKRKSIQA